MQYIYLAAAILMTVLFGPGTVQAGSRAYYCTDASTQFQYDGEQLTWRDPGNPKEMQEISSKKISETLISSDEETCVNKAGRKFVSASKAYLVILEYTNPWSKKPVQGQFLCNDDYDSYPSTTGIDTKCVKTVTKTGRLQDASLVTRTKVK